MIINHANHELYYQQKILSSIIDELGTSIYKKRSSWRNVMPKFFTVDHSVMRSLFLRWTRQIYCGAKWSRFNGCSRMTPVPMNENTDVLNSRFTDHQIDHITRITRDILLLCLHICYFHENATRMESEDFFEGSEPIRGSQHVHTDHGKKNINTIHIIIQTKQILSRGKCRKIFCRWLQWKFSRLPCDYLLV